ncbi:MAG: alpha/beta fold hydrolase [Phycisphaerae bacterium]|nr:alpha/beta fold hydrolase [Phycisphaerae bacterium]
MKPHRIETIALPDGYRCHAAVFAPEPAVAGRRPIVCLHGIQSHGGWFGDSASALAQAGHAVLMPDRRGSGANATSRGHARSIAQLLDDGRTYLGWASELAGGGPVHLLGVSWGGKWATALAAEFPDLVASLILSTPGLYAKRTLGLAGRLAVGLCAGLWPRRRFTIPLSEPELFTDVPRWREFIANDPLRLRRATARFLFVSHLMERGLPAWAAGVRCPTLLLLADRDPIIDNGRAVSLLSQSIPGDRLTVKRFASAVHTLEFVADPSGYFDTLKQWVDSHD